MSTEIKQVERAQACVRYTVTDTGVRTRHVESTVVSIEKAVSDLYISHEAGVKSQTGLLHMLIDDMGKAKWRNKSLKQKNKSLEQENKSLAQKIAALENDYRKAGMAYATKPQLLELLEANPSIIPAETHYVVSQAEGADESSVVRWLLHTPRFQNWLSSLESDLLFVDDRSQLYTLEKVSPFSYLCATLSLSSREMPEAASINFYCGIHAGLQDSLSGPEGLMRSLISQLLLYRDYDFHFINSGEYFAQLGQYDLERLCDTFRHLIEQLPSSLVLFCMIDAFSSYDCSRWKEELHFSLTTLQALVEGRTRGPILKILLTVNRSSRRLQKRVLPQCYIEVADSSRHCDEGISGREIATCIRQSTPLPDSRDVGRNERLEHGGVDDVDVGSDGIGEYGGDSGVDDYE